MKAVIIGPTGATGRELLELLIAAEEVDEVVALVRKPFAVTHPKLRALVVDFDRVEDWGSYISGDVAFSCLGTTLRAAGGKEAQYKVDFGYQYTFARLAREHHVPTFVLISSSGANPKSTLFYPRMKGELEQAVAALKFEHFIVFRPGPLVRPDTDRAGEKAGVAVISFLNKLGLLRNMGPLAVKDLAGLMLRYALNPPPGHTILESGRILRESGA